MVEYYISEELDIQTLEADTIKGLSANPKYLLSKYFYDDKGTSIFTEITKMPEYYLTRCEYEILEENSEQITDAFISRFTRFDLLEPGSGDGSKTRILLKSLLQKNSGFTYIPVDISSKANNELLKFLSKDFPSLKISPVTGDFFALEDSAGHKSDSGKVILFLGSNIGNFTDNEIHLFLNRLSSMCKKNDLLFIGFDLKKSPEIIMSAYNDPHGHTRRFNLNHLVRLNRELDGDFNTRMFEHHTSYDPDSGHLKSYLVSKEHQVVNIRSAGQKFVFKKWEPILMELSRKFDLPEIEKISNNHGFSVLNHFTDQRGWFADSLWIKMF